MIMSISAQGTEHFRIYLFNTKSLGHDNWSAHIYGQYCAIMTIFFKNAFLDVEDWV